MPTVKKVVRPWMVASNMPASRWSKKVKGDIPASFYRNSPWRKLRQRWLEEHPLCQHCYEQKRLTAATVVDHVKPIRLGGEPLDENNLMSLCKPCHERKSGKERHQSM